MEGEVYSKTSEPSAVARVAGKGELREERDDLVFSSEVTSCGLMRNASDLKVRFLPPVYFKESSWQKKSVTQLYQNHIYRLLNV